MSIDPTRALVQGSDYDPARPKGAVILMTATLRPPASAVRRADHEARLQDYLSALGFYLDRPASTADRILFVDNSNAGVEPIVEAARGRPHDKLVEVISFEGNDHDVSRGKAYGEFRLMDHGIAVSSMLADDDWIWKVTGRLKFLNIDELQRRVSGRDYDIVCDLHHFPFVGSGRLRGNRYMDLRTFGIRRAAYDAAYRSAWQHSPAFDTFTMFDVTRAAGARMRVLPRFPVEPMLEGISGRHLREYNSPALRWKAALRGTLRRVVPGLWI